MRDAHAFRHDGSLHTHACHAHTGHTLMCILNDVPDTHVHVGCLTHPQRIRACRGTSLILDAHAQGFRVNVQHACV